MRAPTAIRSRSTLFFCARLNETLEILQPGCLESLRILPGWFAPSPQELAAHSADCEPDDVGKVLGEGRETQGGRRVTEVGSDR